MTTRGGATRTAKTGISKIGGSSEILPRAVLYAIFTAVLRLYWLGPCDRFFCFFYRRDVQKMISFTVPGTPVAKARARATMVAGRARMYTPAKTASYEGKVAYLGKQAMGALEPLNGPVSLTVECFFAYPSSWSKKRIAANLIKREWVTKTPDGDNCLKAVSDALNGVCWRDDCQVARAVVTKMYSDIPCVAVVIEVLS